MYSIVFTVSQQLVFMINVLRRDRSSFLRSYPAAGHSLRRRRGAAFAPLAHAAAALARLEAAAVELVELPVLLALGGDVRFDRSICEAESRRSQRVSLFAVMSGMVNQVILTRSLLNINKRIIFSFSFSYD